MNYNTLSEKTQPTRVEAMASNDDQLRDMTRAVILSTGLDVEKCHAMAEQLHAQLRDRWGGQRVYFHKIGLSQAKARRDYVLAHWDGRNTEEVMRTTGFSRGHIYRIAQEQRHKKAGIRNPCLESECSSA